MKVNKCDIEYYEEKIEKTKKHTDNLVWGNPFTLYWI